MDGKPGPDYWQNHAQYQIEAKFDPSDGRVSGKESIIYHNQSPDSLSRIVIKLLQDLYKEGNLRDFAVSSFNIHQGVEISNVMIAGKPVNLKNPREFSRSGTNLILNLDQHLMPGRQLQIELEWSLTLSKPAPESRRTGAYDSVSWFVGYWYPQVAVYDDIDGWDLNDFSGIQETYNDFNDYQVSVEVPAGYHVWATGTCTNLSEVLQPAAFERFQQVLPDGPVVKVITAEDLNQNIPENQAKTIWRYEAKDVMDFAFATSNRYLWDVAALKIGERTVLAEAVYPREATDFREVAEIARRSIRIFSDTFPAVDFPYPKHTSINALRVGGMEFPMLANNGSMRRKLLTIEVTAHEISHSYFPFLMGTNERKYSWMDEGWAEFMDAYVVKSYGMHELFGARMVYRIYGGMPLDLPLMTPSTFIGRDAYGFNFYTKPYLSYKALQELLGEKIFLQCMQEYISRWRGKHPTPWDFFYTFNDVSGRNLDWFWQAWYFDFGFSDLALESFEPLGNNSIKFTVRNTGGLPVPVRIRLELEGGQSQLIEKPIDIWEKGKVVEFEEKVSGKVLSAELVENGFSDLISENNLKNSGS
jgi:hypothetical protein